MIFIFDLISLDFCFLEVDVFVTVGVGVDFFVTVGVGVDVFVTVGVGVDFFYYIIEQ